MEENDDDGWLGGRVIRWSNVVELWLSLERGREMVEDDRLIEDMSLFLYSWMKSK